jgi:hypothetical protein
MLPTNRTKHQRFLSKKRDKFKRKMNDLFTPPTEYTDGTTLVERENDISRFKNYRKDGKKLG